MGLIIYVSLLLLTPEVLSLPFDPQDNAFLSWAHSYTAFHNWSNCWVCRALPSSSDEEEASHMIVVKSIHRLGESLFLEVEMSTTGILSLMKRGVLCRPSS